MTTKRTPALIRAGLLGAVLLAAALAARAAPTVSLTAPANATVVAAPATVALAATATPDAGTTIKSVAFYRGTTLIGTDTTAPYGVTWTNAAAGTYSLTAVATDSKNKSTTSAAVTLVVDAPPSVGLTAPAANAVVAAGSNIALSASAADADGTVAKVEFYAGATLVGTATAAPYSVTWANAPAGSVSLTARATDDRGIATTSTAVPIIVNAPPSVALTSPAANAAFAAPATVALTANAADADGTIAKVEFYQGTTLIGTATSAPYGVAWANVAAGAYTLTARATDDRGAVTTSAAVPVFVDTPPSVTLTSPLAWALFNAPATLMLTASAADADGTVAKVEFYQGGTLIGTATAAPYSLAWGNVPAGSYSLTARATDDRGGVTTSPAVPVVVNAPPAVAITSPAPGAALTAPATVTLTAAASDPDGTVVQVEYYLGAARLGAATQPPYSLAWADVPAGSYSLTARATDDRGATATSSPLAVTVGAGGTAVYYLHTDHLETPRLVMDAQGAVVWRRAPLDEPFGASPPETDPDANGVPFALNLRFPGQYFDAETNTHYNYFRDYDPATGRYRQSDPIGLQGGINPYAYVDNAPTMKIDPLGLMGQGSGANGGTSTWGKGGPTKEQCDSGPCPDPVTITWTTGLPGAPIDPPETKVYSEKCLLKFGIGVKGSLMAGGTAAQKYGPGIAGKLLGPAVGAAAETLAAAAGSFPGMVLSLTLSVSEVLKHCECKQ